MAESMSADDRQRNMQNGRLIYDLVTANHLDEIHAYLNPLTIRHRQYIVSQKVANKTLLGHACELGFRDIVKYLLDECEANISEHYTPRYVSLSPLRVSIANLDVAMLCLLVSRRAVAADQSEAISCLRHASTRKYFSIVSLLMKYTDKMAPFDDSSNLEDLLTSVTNLNLQNADAFFYASATEDIGRMKALLANDIDTKVTHFTEENALSIAILNEKNNAEHYLLNYRVFSFKDHIRSLELCGAKFIAFRSEFKKGLRCWKKAIRIRSEYSFGVSDKFEKKLQTDLGSEFSCEEQLNMMENHDADLYVQALIVLLRLLSPLSQLLQVAFMTVAKHPAFRQDLFKALKILAQFSQLPYLLKSEWGAPLHIAIKILELIFRPHFISDYSNMADILMKLRHLMDFINGVNWKVLLIRQRVFHESVYIDILKRVLYNIIALNSFDLCIADKVWIKDGISSIMKRHAGPYPTTLLHLAIAEPTAFSFILSCSDDANCTDYLKNTPMHTVSAIHASRMYRLHLVNLLADAGGHIDAVNESNRSPMKTLKSKEIIKNPLKYLSLQCLAAQIIHDKKIIVPEGYPKILVSFIKLHSS